MANKSRSILGAMGNEGKDQVTQAIARDCYRYTVYFEPQTDGGFAVVFPAFPEIVTFGKPLDEARTMARDALRCHLEGLRKDAPPLKTSSSIRRPDAPPINLDRGQESRTSLTA